MRCGSNPLLWNGVATGTIPYHWYGPQGVRPIGIGALPIQWNRYLGVQVGM